MKRLTYSEYIQRANKIHNNKYEYPPFEYTNNKQKITIICPLHGPFEQRANTHLLRKGCPFCYGKASDGEKKILNFLRENDIRYIFEHSFDDCINPQTSRKLRFDFYLSQYNICIEYDGSQHEKQKWVKMDLDHQKYLDSIKESYCKNNNIYLLRINYKDHDIEDIIYQCIKEKINAN